MSLMEEKELQNLQINGSMVVSGGSFNNVSINGRGTINGDVRCKEFKINGACDVNGKLKAEVGVVRGNTKVNEDLYIGDFSVYGNSSLDGNLYSTMLNVKGSCTVKKSVNSEMVKVYGRLHVGDSCKTDHFLGKGVFEVENLLESNKIDIIVNGGKCYAKEIKGDLIDVRLQPDKGVLKFIKNIMSFVGDKSFLYVDLLEGNKINLEGTKAKVVKGSHVIINNDCDIELVEYTDKLEILGSGIVKESKKI